jgi:hypothetical protein
VTLAAVLAAIVKAARPKTPAFFNLLRISILLEAGLQF